MMTNTTVGRPRKHKETPFGGYGLDPEEEDKLKRVLKYKDVSAKQLVRKLLRDYIRQPEFVAL